METSVEATSPLPPVANGTQGKRLFEEWLASHHEMNMLTLPSQAYERASFYEDERDLVDENELAKVHTSLEQR